MIVGTLVFTLLVDMYVWQAIKVLIKDKPLWYRKVITYLFWAVPVILLTTFSANLIFAFFDTYIRMRTYFLGTFVIIYASKLITFLFLIVDDVKRLFVWVWRLIERNFLHQKALAEEEEMEEAIEPQSKKISRSEFIARAGILAGAVPFIMLSRGMATGAYNFQVRRVNLVLPNLPESFDGLKIIQISDIHSGSFTNKDAVYRGINMIKEQKGNIVFFTGDLVNNRTNEVYEWMDMFSEIKAPMGVFSILGNHDYGDYVTDWKSPEEKSKNMQDLVDVHKNLGWNLMRNEHVLLEKENKSIGLIGVENWGDKGRFQKFGDLTKAKAGMPDVPVKILLSHDPSHFDTIVCKQHPDIDLTLAGHTHGFQFGVELGDFKWSPSQYIYPHWADLYKVDKQMIYVNRGFGFIGYPGRVGIMPEITVITLNRTA